MSDAFPINFEGRAFVLVENQTERERWIEQHPEVDAIDIGFCAVALFRECQYVDYIAVCEVHEDEEIWTPCYGKTEMTDWMAGFVYDDPDRKKRLRGIESEVGKFIDLFGWGVNVVLESRPSDREMENYITWDANKEVQDGKLYPPE